MSAFESNNYFAAAVEAASEEAASLEAASEEAASLEAASEEAATEEATEAASEEAAAEAVLEALEPPQATMLIARAAARATETIFFIIGISFCNCKYANVFGAAQAEPPQAERRGRQTLKLPTGNLL